MGTFKDIPCAVSYKPAIDLLASFHRAFRNMTCLPNRPKVQIAASPTWYIGTPAL